MWCLAHLLSSFGSSSTFSPLALSKADFHASCFTWLYTKRAQSVLTTAVLCLWNARKHLIPFSQWQQYILHTSILFYRSLHSRRAWNLLDSIQQEPWGFVNPCNHWRCEMQGRAGQGRAGQWCFRSMSARHQCVIAQSYVNVAAPQWGCWKPSSCVGRVQRVSYSCCSTYIYVGTTCIGTGCVIAKKGKGTSPNLSVSHVIMIMIHNDI